MNHDKNIFKKSKIIIQISSILVRGQVRIIQNIWFWKFIFFPIFLDAKDKYSYENLFINDKYFAESIYTYIHSSGYTSRYIIYVYKAK